MLFLEISKVRGSLFQLSKVDDHQTLPQPTGAPVTLSEKLVVPVNEYPDVRVIVYVTHVVVWLVTVILCPSKSVI